MEVLIGKQPINGPFSIAMFDYQRVVVVCCGHLKSMTDTSELFRTPPRSGSHLPRQQHAALARRCPVSLADLAGKLLESQVGTE